MSQVQIRMFAEQRALEFADLTRPHRPREHCTRTPCPHVLEASAVRLGVMVAGAPARDALAGSRGRVADLAALGAQPARVAALLARREAATPEPSA